MSYSVRGTTITLTRGDTFGANIEIYRPDGTLYEPQEGDTIRFAMKAKITDAEPIILKDIPISTMMLVILPEETKDLQYGNYVYDIELTKANGAICTFITKSTLKLTEEVY